VTGEGLFSGSLNNNVEVYLLADRRGVHPRRLILTLLQRELVFGCFPVNRVVEVHAGHVAVQVVPVQQESALEYIKRWGVLEALITWWQRSAYTAVPISVYSQVTAIYLWLSEGGWVAHSPGLREWSIANRRILLWRLWVRCPLVRCGRWRLLPSSFCSYLKWEANGRYDILSMDVRGIANNMINICIRL